ncbi:MAG: c-type cytochrome [Caulobacteraceae bacterium]|nr:c-type cytochrome [Caulobacteraceae bacterium]
MPRAAAVIAMALLIAAGSARAGVGEDAYREQCASCHALNGVSTPEGPSLNGVVWRKIAALADFPYSPGLKAKRGTWTPGMLDAYLKDTQGFAPGTDMFWDLRDDVKRRAIIDYLKSIK